MASERQQREAEIQKHFYDSCTTTFRGVEFEIHSNKRVVSRIKKYLGVLRRDRNIDRVINYQYRQNLKRKIPSAEAMEMVEMGWKDPLAEIMTAIAMWACCTDSLFKLTDDGLESEFDVVINPDYWPQSGAQPDEAVDDFDKLFPDKDAPPEIIVNPKNPLEIMIAIVLAMMEEDEKFSNDLTTIASKAMLVASGVIEGVAVDQIGFLSQRLDESLVDTLEVANRATKREHAGNGDGEIKVIVRRTEDAGGEGVQGGIDRGASDQGDAILDSGTTDEVESANVPERLEES